MEETSKIGVDEAIETKLSGSLDDSSLIDSAFQITSNGLDGNSVGLFRIMGETSNLADSKSNIRTRREFNLK